jgi:hypothetical protein
MRFDDFDTQIQPEEDPHYEMYVREQELRQQVENLPIKQVRNLIREAGECGVDPAGSENDQGWVDVNRHHLLRLLQEGKTRID